jgi:fucose 4-O-acetylase-like acetyltransferase
MQKTIDWVDNAKAACIFLVVWGHFYAINPEAKALIYSVHLPAFLFVTGFLTGEGMLKNPLRWLLLEQERFYVLVYAFFTILASVLWYGLEARQHPLSEILRPLKGGLLGLHGPGLNLVHNDDPLWYFPFLITSTAFGYALLKLPMPVALPVCFISAGLSSFLNMPPLPWSLDLAPIGAMFILLGVALRTRSDVLSRPAFRDKKTSSWRFSHGCQWCCSTGKST